METLALELTSRRIWIGHDSAVGEARRQVVSLLDRVSGNASPPDREQAALVASELARNVVRHADGGELVATLLHGEGAVCLDLMVTDRPASDRPRGAKPSLGIGLEVVENNTDQVRRRHTREAGWLTWARLGRLPEGLGWDVAGLVLPRSGETQCGDAAGVWLSPEEAKVVVLDGLGHGVLASDASSRGLRALLQAWRDRPTGPEEDLEVLQEGLAGTRGCAGHVLRKTRGQAQASSRSVGNVNGLVLDRSGRLRRVPNGFGVLGQASARPRSQLVEEGALWLLHTDGLRERSIEGLRQEPGIAPELYVAYLHATGRRIGDDCGIVVLRELEAWG